MKTIAIITARGGSKRIPKKNIKEFCGKPIIAYSIEAALTSNIFDEVMVSTDSTEIADIAKQYGAKVPFLRSDASSNDFATTEDVLIEVLNRYGKMGNEFEVVCCIYPTAPFITAKRLEAALDLLAKDRNIDSVIPVVKYSFPPQRALIEINGALQYQYPEFSTARSQDLKPVYHDCGQFYICRVKELIKCHDLITSRSVPYIIPEDEVQDIDNNSDWIIAEQKYANLLIKKEEEHY